MTVLHFVGKVKTKDDLYMTLSLHHPADSIMTAFHIRSHLAGGMGNRDLGRQCFNWIADCYPFVFIRVIHLIPKYGRWDDLLYIENASVQPFLFQTIAIQLQQDILHVMNGRSVSTCAKWMPSEHKSFARKYPSKFKALLATLGMTKQKYRTILSLLRHSTASTEHFLCTKKFDSLCYDTVPYNAMQRYEKLFLKKDTERFVQWKMNRPFGSSNGLICSYTDVLDAIQD